MKHGSLPANRNHSKGTCRNRRSRQPAAPPRLCPRPAAAEDPIWQKGRGYPCHIAHGRPPVPAPAAAKIRTPCHGVPAALPRPWHLRHHVTQLPLRLGRTRKSGRLSRTIRATRPGTQQPSRPSRLRQESSSHPAALGGLRKEHGISRDYSPPLGCRWLNGLR